MKCQPKQPTIPIENVSIRHILTRMTKLPIQNAELPLLTVANRIRIEEFGKQEFFIHYQISLFHAPPFTGFMAFRSNSTTKAANQNRHRSMSKLHPPPSLGGRVEVHVVDDPREIRAKRRSNRRGNEQELSRQKRKNRNNPTRARFRKKTSPKTCWDRATVCSILWA